MVGKGTSDKAESLNFMRNELTRVAFAQFGFSVIDEFSIFASFRDEYVVVSKEANTLKMIKEKQERSLNMILNESILKIAIESKKDYPNTQVYTKYVGL